MVGLVIQKQYSGISAPAGANTDITVGEMALYDRTDLLDWFEAKLVDQTSSNVASTVYPFRNRTSGSVTFLSNSNTADSPVVNATSDGQIGLWAVSGSGRTIRGNINSVLPAPPWTVCMLYKCDLNFDGVLFSTETLANNVVVDFNTSNQIAFYPDYNGQFIRVRGAPDKNDGNLHFLTIQHNGANGSIYVDGTLYVTAAIGNNVPGVLRFGTRLDANGAAMSPYEGYWETFWSSNTVSSDFVNACKAVARERHPSLTIA